MGVFTGVFAFNPPSNESRYVITAVTVHCSRTLSKTRDATKGGLEGAQAPPSLKRVCPVIRPDPITFFIRGGPFTCTIMDTCTIISLQPSQTHTYQTTSVLVFQNSQTVNDR